MALGNSAGCAAWCFEAGAANKSVKMLLWGDQRVRVAGGRAAALAEASRKAIWEPSRSL